MTKSFIHLNLTQDVPPKDQTIKNTKRNKFIRGYTKKQQKK